MDRHVNKSIESEKGKMISLLEKEKRMIISIKQTKPEM